MAESSERSALAVVDRQLPATAPAAAVAALEFSQSQLDVIKSQIAKGASNAELGYFIEACRALALNPLKREIYCVMRYDKKAQREVMTIQIAVAGYRTMAERTGLYGGQEAIQWCGKDGQWRDVWLEDGPPAAAKCVIYRRDWQSPVTQTVTYKSFVQKYDGRPSGLWAQMPDHMLAIRAESHALRRAFPTLMEQARDAIRGPVGLEIEGDDAIEIPGRQRPVTLLEGSESIPWTQLPAGQAEQAQEFLTAFAGAKSHAILNQVKGDADRQGLGPMLEPAYLDARKRLTERKAEQSEARTETLRQAEQVAAEARLARQAAREAEKEPIEAESRELPDVDLETGEVLEAAPADLDPDAVYITYQERVESAQSFQELGDLHKEWDADDRLTDDEKAALHLVYLKACKALSPARNGGGR